MKRDQLKNWLSSHFGPARSCASTHQLDDCAFGGINGELRPADNLLTELEGHKKPLPRIGGRR